MYTQNKMKTKNNRLILILPLLLILPIIITFDILYYFLTKPACLSCANVLEFLKGASLTVFLLGSVGYKLNRKK